MATIIHDPRSQQRVIAEREAKGLDQFDEVWEGAYMMTPWANLEHQDLAFELGTVFREILRKGGNPGKVYLSPNLSDRESGWERNFRVPDIGVFLKTTSAKNHRTHWSGPADFLVEIISPDDKSREKLTFFAAIGVRELLLVDRNPWALELYRLEKGQLQLVARDTRDQPAVVSLDTLPADLRLLTGEARPTIEVNLRGTDDLWLV